jgi:hypothetical protein
MPPVIIDKIRRQVWVIAAWLRHRKIVQNAGL